MVSNRLRCKGVAHVQAALSHVWHQTLWHRTPWHPVKSNAARDCHTLCVCQGRQRLLCKSGLEQMNSQPKNHQKSVDWAPVESRATVKNYVRICFISAVVFLRPHLCDHLAPLPKKTCKVWGFPLLLQNLLFQKCCYALSKWLLHPWKIGRRRA